MYDNNPGTWGHIQVDAIRMVAFAAVPEPASVALGGGVLLAAFGLWKRRRSG